jgi:hypothetical protein
LTSKEHTTLYTIFNRNDPSPTASALRNHSYDSAVIFVLGEISYNKKHRGNLSRFKTWISGSPKNHSNTTGESDNHTQWPDIFWKKQWDWPSLSNEQISFISSDNITDELIQSVGSNDIFDLTSGTKGQCANLIQKISINEKSVNFFLQTRNGNSLNLSNGTLTKNNSPLSFRERVWLSSGYIVDYGKPGNPIRGEKLAKIRKVVQEAKKGVTVTPNEVELSKIFKVKKVNMHAGFWLEEVTTHMISNWPEINESYVGPRLIHNSFTRAARVSFHTLSLTLDYHKKTQEIFKNHIEKITEINELEDYEKMKEATLDFLVDTEFTKEQIHKIVACLHSIEFDAVAFDHNSGNVFACECKAMVKAKPGVLGRINSITKLVFPTYGTPVLVYSGSKSVKTEGVNLISWPELSNPNVIDKLSHGEILDYKSTGSEKKENNSNDKTNNEQFKPFKFRLKVLKSTLKFLKYNPMSWVLFEEKLRSSGYGKIGKLHKGLRTKPYGKKLAKEMGFEINTSSDSLVRNKLLETGDWITWNDSSINQVSTEEKIADEKSIKFTEEIQVDDKDILEIINDYYQSGDLFTEIIIDSNLRTINIKTTKPGRVMGTRGMHLNSVAKAIKRKLGVEFKIHIVK